MSELTTQLWDRHWEEAFALKRTHLEARSARSTDVRYATFSSFAACCEVLNDTTCSVYSDDLKKTGQNNLLFMNPPEHSELRSKLCDSLPTVEDLARQMRGHVETVVSPLGCEREFDLVAQFSLPLAARASCALMGLPSEDANFITPKLCELASLFDPTASDASRRHGEEIGVELLYYCSRVIRQHTGASNGACGALTALYSRGLLTREQLLVSCVLLMHASFENLSNFLSFAAAEILSNPVARAGIDNSDASQRRRCIDEMVRLASPARILRRQAMTSRVMAGEMIERGCHVLALVGKANRDPTYFESPDQLDLGAPRRMNLAFGLGPHSCPGAQIARREAEVALVGLSRTCSGQVESLQTEWKDNVVMFGPARVDVRLG